MKKALTIITLFFFFLLLGASRIQAHSGRTNSAGCHNCYVGACAGTYHCHGGGIDLDVEPNYPPPPKIQRMPLSNATFQFIPNSEGSFTVKIDWDRPNNGQWSIVLSKNKGADPGPLTDTFVSEYTFENVKTGTHYINIKEGMPNGYWSEVSYWTVEVPAWTSPTPSPTTYVIPTPLPDKVTSVKTPTKNNDDGDGIWGLAVLGLIGGAYWLGNKQKKTPNEPSQQRKEQ